MKDYHQKLEIHDIAFFNSRSLPTKEKDLAVHVVIRFLTFLISGAQFMRDSFLVDKGPKYLTDRVPLDRHFLIC